MIYTDVVKDKLLSFLQQLFAQQEFYGSNGDMGNPFLWHHDLSLTKILIVDSNTEDLEREEVRPALVISRAPIQWAKLAIDQVLRQDWITGERIHSDLLSTSLRVNCFSRNGLEAEKLATIVFKCVQYFARDLRSSGQVFDVASVSIGEESIVKHDSRIDLSVVPVLISMTIQDTWKIREDGVLVSSMGININYGGVLPSGKTVGRHSTDP